MLRIERVTTATQQNIRDLVQKHTDSLNKITESGFMMNPSHLAMWKEATDHGQNLSKQFETLGILGIGGSSLGPKVIQQYLGFKSNKRLLVLENVDPVSFENKVSEVKDLAKAHWLVISKSGKTLETLSQLTLLLKKYKKAGLNISKHFTVISDPVSNPLTDWARTHQSLQLSIPQNVGGRFSVLTPVGIVPAAFLGVNTAEFREGALKATEARRLVEDVVAQTLMSYERSEWITVFWQYSDLLSYFGGWIQQLWAESLAKKVNRKGEKAKRVSTPLPLVGANDQHSILQQVMEGSRDKFVIFIGVDSVENSGEVFGKEIVGLPMYLEKKTMGDVIKAERQATQEALEAEGIQSLTLMVKDLSPASLGFLFQFFEMVVALIAECYNINAFDQPGVELGKRLAFGILENRKV